MSSSAEAQPTASQSNGLTASEGQGSQEEGKLVRKSMFARMRYDSPQRYVVTPAGTFHLTPTELLLVRTIEELDGKTISKKDLADRLHRNAKVISRLLSRLRHEQIIESIPTYREDGGCAQNSYRIAPQVHPLHMDND